MKNIVIGLLIIAAFVGGYFFSQKYNFKIESKKDSKEIIEISPTSQTLVGNDKDSHGCIGSAGYSWCELKQKCLRPFEEKCEEEDLTKIVKQLLIDKYGSQANNLTVTVSKKNGDFAKGAATAEGDGGIWLAAKESGSWKIVFDGNGVPDCQLIKANYKFPADVLVNICD